MKVQDPALYAATSIVWRHNSALVSEMILQARSQQARNMMDQVWLKVLSHHSVIMNKNHTENMRGFIALISILALKFDPVATLADNPDLVVRANALGIPPGVSCFHKLLAQAGAEVSRRVVD